MSDDASPTQRIPRAEVRERLLAAGYRFLWPDLEPAIDDVAARTARP